MSSGDYEYWTTIGTVGAVVVALCVALGQATVALVLTIKRRRVARRKVASLVSVWVERAYTPSPDGDYYQRVVALHLANESDEPVFRVEVLCGIETERGTIQVGPLSAPRVIPVLPPKREFVYDVTMGMLGFDHLAHDTFNGLVAEVGFRDHEGKRWERRFDGTLELVKKPRAAVIVEAGDDLMLAQAGPVESPYNPFARVVLLTQVASDDDVGDEQFHAILTEEASGWSRTSAKDVGALREMLRTGNLATHVWYPAPRIAYVRLLDELPDSSGGPRAQILTLVWRNGRGWTLFGLGPYLPWDIGFEPGELEIDPLAGRENP